MLPGPSQSDSGYVEERAELRQHVARTLTAEADAVANDAVAVFPFVGLQGDTDEQKALADAILQLLIVGTRDGEVDPRSGAISDLRQLAGRRNVGIQLLFGLIYLIERSALDQLALDESFGATSEPWPSIAQLVRRSSFNVLAALTEQISRDPGEAGVLDPLTTLHTKAVFMAALDKEIQRAERFRLPTAVILLDVDRLADINARHGYGAGDRVLERIGIIVRNYFREHDWVARFGDDTFAVLLPSTQPEHAEQLAERVRATVEQRLELHDYRSQEQVPVTVSVGVLIAEAVDQTARAEQLMNEARHAVERAKQAGRNRVERIDITMTPSTVPPARDTLSMD